MTTITDNARALLNAIMGADKFTHGHATVSEVARTMGVSTQRVNGIVNGAQRSGLVEKPGKGLVGLTPKGIAALDLVEATAEEARIEKAVDGDPEAGATSTILRALEAGWRSIQARHEDTPDVQIIVASGLATRRKRQGHWHANQWEGRAAHEVLISAEHLANGAEAVLATLIHEAAHGIAHARDIKDTSRQGRWHNTKYKAIAEEIGLTVEKDPKHGYALTGMLSETVEAYAVEIMRLDAAIGGSYKVRPPQAEKKATTPRVQWKAALVSVIETIQIDELPEDEETAIREALREFGIEVEELLDGE